VPDLSSRTSGCLHISVETGFVPAGPVAELLSSFGANFPGISFSIKKKSGKKIRENLISGLTSMVFCRKDLVEDFAKQMSWQTTSLHMVCSDRILNEVNARTAELLRMPLIDTGKDFPTLSLLLEEYPELRYHIAQRTPDRICTDRNMAEHLIRSGMVGALPLALHESLPQKIRALDHVIHPKKTELVLSVRKKESRDLIETLFIEHFLEMTGNLPVAV
jgi:hypothetical protein